MLLLLVLQVALHCTRDTTKQGMQVLEHSWTMKDKNILIQGKSANRFSFVTMEIYKVTSYTKEPLRPERLGYYSTYDTHLSHSDLVSWECDKFQLSVQVQQQEINYWCILQACISFALNFCQVVSFCFVSTKPMAVLT